MTTRPQSGQGSVRVSIQDSGEHGGRVGTLVVGVGHGMLNLVLPLKWGLDTELSRMLVIPICQDPQEVLGWRDLHSDVLFIFNFYLFFLIFNYLAVSGLSRGTWDVCFIMQDLSLWLHHVGFLVATHRLQIAWAL